MQSCLGDRDFGEYDEKITPIEIANHVFDIHRDLSVSTRKSKPGPPERIDGMTVGIVTMTGDAPHGGEVHPDGDEILLVISGKLRISCDSFPGQDTILTAGQACIVP